MKTTSTLILLTILLAARLAIAQDQQSIFDLIAKADNSELIIEANFDSIIQQKYTTDYYNATLRINGDDDVWDIKLRTRGKFRRRVCDFPPIKLEFSKKELKSKNLLKFDDLKLVTHCKNEDVNAQQNVLKEKLAYKIFQKMTPYHFRTQVVQVTYINTGTDEFKIERLGMIIEDEDDMSHRLNGEVLDTFGIEWQQLNLHQAEVVATFQYLIGNTDWNVRMNRNLKLLKVEGEEKIYVVPYDFDMSGLVSPSYGIPDSNYGHTSMKDRSYLGKTKPSPETIQLFKDKEEEILEDSKNYKVLPSYSRRDIIRYIKSFYVELEEGLVGASGQ